jgi:hypothetical protein
LDGGAPKHEHGGIVIRLARKPAMLNLHQSRITAKPALMLGRAPLNSTVASAITVHLRRPGWLHATGGALWVTRPNVVEDIVIAANGWCFLDAGRRVVIEPLQRSVATGVLWCPLSGQLSGDRQDLAEAPCHRLTNGVSESY